jgi:hypothetical protein
MELGVNETVIDATGTAITVIDDASLFPSLVAVIVAGPIAWAVTSPFKSTEAIAGADDVQVTTRPASGIPLPSLSVAVSCCVEPMMMLAVVGLTVTVATGTGVMMRVAPPLLVSLVAVMWTVPGAKEVTNPLGETVARVVLSDPHVTTRPVNAFPAASKVVAVAWMVCPATIEPEPRETLTVATGIGVTVIVAVATRPSLTAVTFATPGETAATRPPAETVATLGASVLQSIVRPESALW